MLEDSSWVDNEVLQRNYLSLHLEDKLSFEGWEDVSMPGNYNLIKEDIEKIAGREELSDVESLDEDLGKGEFGSTDHGPEHNSGEPSRPN